MTGRLTRKGVTLVELLVAMVVASVLGGALFALMTAANRFEDQAEGLRDARRTGRGALNAITSDLRMVDPEWGIEVASSTSITVRASFAMGLVCASTATTQTIMLFPVDSVALTLPGLSGYATRAVSGAMTPNTTSLTMAQLGSTPSSCTSAGIGTLSAPANAPNARSRPITLTGSSLPVVSPGTIVMLYRRVRYYFASSSLAGITGRNSLWRDFLDDAVVGEEIAAPFDATAAFRYYNLAATVSQTAVPSPLTATRGVELFLPGESDNVGRRRSGPEQADMTTSIFFVNRRT